MKYKELIFCGLLIGLSVLLVAGSARITPLAELSITSLGAYPLFVSCLCLLSGLWVALETAEGKNPRALPDWPLFDRDVLGFVGLMVLYFVCLNSLRYTAGTLIFTFAAVWFLDRVDWKKSLAVATMCTAANLLIFKYVFSVIMP